jgi:phosphatidylserine/phosphatidylglycerophosphate/cardiolipin synthase-like enzyme
VRRLRTWRRLALLAFLLAWVATAYWEANKPLPDGAHVASPWVSVSGANVSFIADITAADAYGRPVVSQAIFDSVLQVVRSARHFIVLDYFLFNDQGLTGDPRSPGAGPSAPLRNISGELRDALLEQRRTNPGLKVLFITDPINEIYGSVPSRDFILLRAAGVDVAVTDLDALRDSNLVYSGFWRLAIRWWNHQGSKQGWLPNPLDESDARVSFGAWAKLANFKANHRKVVIADDGHDQLVGIVASANPHDASSAHSNVAAKVTGPALIPLLQSELAVARFSGWKGEIAVPGGAGTASDAGGSSATTPASETDANLSDDDLNSGRVARVKVVTEGAILDSLIQHIDAAGKGDSIDIAMFYIADRAVIESLVEASRRGADIRLILDPNKDAFGHEKSGIPNRPVAGELVSASEGGIHVRWYRTHGEQFHTKLVMIYGPQRLWMTLGSANLTRRNLEDYNLEANLNLEVGRASPLGAQALDYFDALWGNRAGLGIEYTADFAAYSDPAQTHYWLYRFMEDTGLSTF